MATGFDEGRFAGVGATLGSLLAYLLAPSKRRKARLLLADRLLTLRGAWSGRRPTVASAPEPSSSEWHYRSSVPLPAELFAASTMKATQDVLRDGSRLVTDFDYRIVRLDGAMVCANQVDRFSVHDAAGTLAPEFSNARGSRRLPRRPPYRVGRFVEGETASAYGNVAMADGNYSHWLIDGLPRLLLIARERPLDAFDHVLVPPLRASFQTEMLELFGIGPERTLELPPLECVRFEHLVCTTPPRGAASSVCPGWAIDGYRALAREELEKPRGGRRLYVSRRDAPSRRFTNEEEVAARLERRGFETVALSEHDFRAKIALFAGADCIVGLTGAGLINAMFCAPRTTFVELVPPSLVDCIASSVCGYLDLDYHFLMLDDRPAMSRLSRHHGDFRLDVDKLERSLERLGY